MKEIFSCCFILITSLTSMGQDTIASRALTKEDYMLKSRNQIRAAMVFAGVGSAMTMVGLLVGIDDVGGVFNPEDKVNTELAEKLIYGGIAVAAVSVPFFISYSKSRKKAAKLSIQPQAVISIKNGTVVDRTVPLLSIRMFL